MDLTEKLTRRCAEQSDENAQIHDELSILRSDHEKEKQMRHQFEVQLNEANKLIEKVLKLSHSNPIQPSHLRIIPNVCKNYEIMRP